VIKRAKVIVSSAVKGGERPSGKGRAAALPDERTATKSVKSREVSITDSISLEQAEGIAGC
jgi:hypothetical protein